MKNSFSQNNFKTIFTVVFTIINACLLYYIIGAILFQWDQYYKTGSLKTIKEKPKNSTFVQTTARYFVWQNKLSFAGYKKFVNSILCSIKSFSIRGPYLRTFWRLLYGFKQFLLWVLKLPFRILHFLLSPLTYSLKYVFCAIRRGKFISAMLAIPKRIFLSVWRFLYSLKLKMIKLICIYCNIMQPPAPILPQTENKDSFLPSDVVPESADDSPCVKIIKKKVYVTKDVPVIVYVEPTNCPKQEIVTKIEYDKVTDKMDDETINKLRNLVKDIHGKQENLDKMLTKAENEIAQIKQIIQTLKPSLTQEEADKYMESLTSYDIDIGKLVNDTISSIDEQLSSLMKEHEVQKSLNGKLINSFLIHENRQMTNFTFKLEHPTFITRMSFEKSAKQNVPTSTNDMVKKINVHFISRNYILQTESLSLEGIATELVLQKPVLCDSILIEVKEYNGQGDQTVIPNFHVIESRM